MKKCLIVYYSQGGTTDKVAKKIATGLHAAEYQTDLYNIKEKSPPETVGYDLLGIGSPTYYFRPPFNVTDYLNSLPKLYGLPTFVFTLHGTYQGDCGNIIRHALVQKEAQDVGYFHCHGADYFYGYLKEGYLFSPDSPTAGELAQAEDFGRRLLIALRVKDILEHQTTLILELYIAWSDFLQIAGCVTRSIVVSLA